MMTLNLKFNIKRYREIMDYSQEDAARDIGVSLSTVQRWERQGGRPTRLARAALELRFREKGLIA